MKLTWADGGYAGKLATWAAATLRMTLEIVRRPDDLHTFQVLPTSATSAARATPSTTSGMAAGHG